MRTWLATGAVAGLLALSVVVLAVAGAVGAAAATFVVRPDGTGDYPTIQAAINASSAGDVIELTDGVFTGSGNRDVEFGGREVTVRSQSGDPATCIIDCEGTQADTHRAFLFLNGEGPSAMLRWLTITGAVVNGC
jgi:hypothetical protein